ncbi:hypothetical protein BDE36_1803 [Arcticibacter tournemirensis]|uniref:Uncharacterized protein n=2 Tax=Arcticibacter tournemirensis TaxID=699437 RepID=A0A5M9HBR8_9SPHI|nr:hypothetical protein [Arcticibacter tournemirensis]KAA8483735.1 hypothetical protein F1649_07550 [Arcticibacter tournemirensis]TQM50068.1 hypothetical protein BDE36_1803 [Arcticibacter tournemirensis]
MDDIKIPSVGRIVHYFPVNDVTCSANNATVVPAIIVQNWGGLVSNISVFPANPDSTNVFRLSVQHKSQVPKDTEGNPLGRYWDWPEIK